MPLAKLSSSWPHALGGRHADGCHWFAATAAVTRCRPARIRPAGTVMSMTVPPGARPIWSGPGSAAMIDLTGRGTFFPHWFEFMCLAAQARDRAQEAAATSEGQPTSEALTTILFSALAAEALINELAEAAARAANLHADTPGFDILADLAATLDMTEKAQGQIDLKYQLTSKILIGKTFPPGEAPFQDFASLITLRNELVHPRHRDRTTAAGHVEPISKVVRDLQQRGLTTTRGRRPGDIPGGVSWLGEIKSSGVANWAYNASREIIAAVLTMLPDDPGLPTTLLFRDRISAMP
jgi:hypothetical protein